MKDIDLNLLKSDINERKQIEGADVDTLFLCDCVLAVVDELKEYNSNAKVERDRKRVNNRISSKRGLTGASRYTRY